MIPPHATAELDYYNNGETSNGAKISIASAHPGGTYAVTFRLNIVGCHIEHSGGTGQVVLNDPADGDVTSFVVKVHCLTPPRHPFSDWRV